MEFFAPCPRGLESVLADELKSLGATQSRATEGGASFGGDERLLYRANLESRIASRILLRVGEGNYRGEEDIYRIASRLPWFDWFDRKRTIRVALAATRSPLKSLDFVTLRVKDAVCDAFRKATGARPNVDTRFPEVRIHIFVDAHSAQFYLDTSGEPLFKRGWRTGSVDAPLRENLAAGILRLAGWTPELALLDPMCGGGTFLLEAASIARGLAPGANRGFGFERLTRYDARLWREVRRESQSAQLDRPTLPIYGSDQDPKAIRATTEALRRAGLLESVQLERADVLEVQAPTNTGILIANPPYGVRIGERQSLAAWYPRLGDVFKQRFAGWRCFILSADLRLPNLIRLKAARRTPLFNGSLECRLYEFAIVAGSMRARGLAQTTDASTRAIRDRPQISKTT
jgi:putative N6-adenine-specific DNA methylase